MKKKLILILVIVIISLLFACGKKYYNEWVIKDGKQYYYDEKGKKIKNCEYIIDSDTYCFNDKGQMLTGFQIVKGNKMYFGLTGRKQYGWKEINEKWYYFDYNSGIMMTGKLNDQGKQYYFYDSGEMGLGWFYIKDKNKYVYLGKDGIVKYGWHSINGKWYFFNQLNGYMFVGWNEVDGKWFYFDQTDGDLKTNQWIDNTYFVNENGEMLNNGWHNVLGQMLYFESDGKVNLSKKFVQENKSQRNSSSSDILTFKYIFNADSISAVYRSCYNYHNSVRSGNKKDAYSLYSKVQELKGLVKISKTVDAGTRNMDDRKAEEYTILNSAIVGWEIYANRSITNW